MSAAVQPPQHQQQSTSSPSSARDPYAAASPPSSSSRRSARPSNNPNAAASPSGSNQQASYSSPSAPSSAAMTTPRASEPMSSSTYKQFYPDSAVPGPAAALPARTSSQNAPTTATADGRSYTSRAAAQSSTTYNPESGRDRQRTQESPRDDGRSQRPVQPPSQSRSAAGVERRSVETLLPRENSVIIQHIVVDDQPKTDITREKARVAETASSQTAAAPAPAVTTAPEKQHRSRQEFKQSSNRKEVKFGEYILGQTLGEGEFGKVKMGWKKGSSVQVAIKLMHTEQMDANRRKKVYREIDILKGLDHRHIVKLHEFLETQTHMGIILEYASGGELFDYILNHRYLKDPVAQELFAQLVAGVGYLHENGIVHRDLKLENLLLDRNSKIIITDFGFANTFDPADELGDEIERRIGDKDFVRRQGLDKQRRGDLMQTSCGSPCYAAPELVVSDGMYTGRKVDVWSCGVILYAMLAGYLPFDDDPNNPEGDNINLLYKYIVSSSLTFPEYVTPHSRDLLRQILVPDPRKRADLFMVARHSWLIRQTNLVGFISSRAKSNNINNAANSNRDYSAPNLVRGPETSLGRSASVREPTGRSPAPRSAGATAAPKQNFNETEDARNWQRERDAERDAKRRTVQLEYVAPQNLAGRAEPSYAGAAAQGPVVATASGGRTRARGDGQGPVEVSSTTPMQIQRKEVPSHAMPPPARPGRDQIRATSDSPAVSSPAVRSSGSRPNTGGPLGARLPSRGNSYSQPSIATPTNANAQGHFSQPKSSSGYIISAPMNPAVHQAQVDDSGRPMSQQHLVQYGQPPPAPLKELRKSERSHKRSSTLGSIGDRLLGRSNSRRRDSSSQSQDTAGAPPTQASEKKDRKYPPVSMRNTNFPASNNNLASEDFQQQQQVQPRPSTESTRRTSFGFSRRNLDSSTSNSDSRRNSRRFSFLPNFSSSGSGGGRKYSSSQTAAEQDFAQLQSERRPESKSGRTSFGFGRGASRSPSRSTVQSASNNNNNNGGMGYFENDRTAAPVQRSGASQASMANFSDKALPPQPGPQQHYQGQQQQYQGQGQQGFPEPPPMQRKQWRDDGYGSNLLDSSDPPAGSSATLQPGAQEPVERFYTPSENLLDGAGAAGGNGNGHGSGNSGHARSNTTGNLLYGYSRHQQGQQQQQQGQGQGQGQQMPGSAGSAAQGAEQLFNHTGQNSIRPSGRKFANEYEHGYAGSSSATRRVMDFFRRRGRDRGEVS